MHADVYREPGTNPGDPCRLAMVLDKQTNGALPTAPTDIYQAPSGIAEVRSMRNLANSNRFVILKKWDWMENPTSVYYNAGAVYTPSVKHIEFYKRCNIPIEYSETATDGSIATIKSNNIYLFFGTHNASAGQKMKFHAILRFRYSDA